MATAGAQYIIACYSSQAGTFGQKLICQGRRVRGGSEGRELCRKIVHHFLSEFDNWGI